MRYEIIKYYTIHVWKISETAKKDNAWRVVAEQAASDGKWFTATVTYSFDRRPSGEVWHERQMCKWKDSHRHGIQAFVSGDGSSCCWKNAIQYPLSTFFKMAWTLQTLPTDGTYAADATYRRHGHYLPTLPINVTYVTLFWKPGAHVIGKPLASVRLLHSAAHTAG